MSVTTDQIPSNFGQYRRGLIDIVSTLERGRPLWARILHLGGMLMIQTAQDLHESKQALQRLSAATGTTSPSQSGDTATTGVQP